MRLLLTATCLLLAPAAARALDLTPQRTHINADGLALPAVFFQDGEKRVFISPPVGWTVTGEAKTAVLRHESSARSNVVFALSPAPLLPTDVAKQKTLREAVVATAPKGAENVVIENEAANPVPLNGWASYQLQLAYDVLGTRFSRTVLVIRLNNFEELQVVVTAPAKDFPSAAAAAQTCLATWHKE